VRAAVNEFLLLNFRISPLRNSSLRAK